MAAYRFFDDSAYEKLFLYSYELSAYNMLKRAGFSSEERYMVYDEIGYDKEKEHDIIVKTEFSQLCEKIKNSEKFSLPKRFGIREDNMLLFVLFV